MKQFFILLLAILFSLNLSYGQEDYIRQILKSKLEHFLDSVDYASVHDDFWAEDLIYTSSSGERFGKQKIMSGFENGDEVSNESKVSYSAENIQIRINDDMAIVAFKLVSESSPPEGRNEYFNTGTFLNRNNEWKVVEWQATKIPQ
ncbi:MAG: nuclear transport factor 2 family protein [Bacteroidota bacterium]